MQLAHQAHLGGSTGSEAKLTDLFSSRYFVAANVAASFRTNLYCYTVFVCRPLARSRKSERVLQYPRHHVATWAVRTLPAQHASVLFNGADERDGYGNSRKSG